MMIRWYDVDVFMTGRLRSRFYFCIYFEIYLWDRRQESQRQVHKPRKKCAHTEGRWGSWARSTAMWEVKEIDTHQGQPTGPTEPRTTPIPLTKATPKPPSVTNKGGETHYLHCPFQFHSICKPWISPRLWQNLGRNVSCRRHNRLHSCQYWQGYRLKKILLKLGAPRIRMLRWFDYEVSLGLGPLRPTLKREMGLI